MAVCKECGLIVPDGSRFCNGCGSKIEQAPIAAEENKIEEATETIDEMEEDDDFYEDEYDEDDEDFDEDPEEEIEEETVVKAPTKKPDFSQLSTANTKEIYESKEDTFNPLDDPYWDDVLPEIDNEVYQIPKDIILKGVVSVIALFAVMAYLIIML